MEQQKKLTIMGHLRELRRRLLICVIAVTLTTGASFFMVGHVFEFFKSRAPADVTIIYTGVTEMLGAYIKVALYCGVALALPFIIYQVVMFVSPALTRTEKRYMYTLLPAAVVFFVAGVGFAYYILLPPALNFLLSFGGDIAEPMISIGNYTSVLVKLMFWIGVVFEIPLVMYFLGKLRVVSSGWLLKKWKWSFLIAFALGAIITPTMDPVNQTLVALPIVVLYLLGTLLVWIGQPSKKHVPVPQARAEP